MKMVGKMVGISMVPIQFQSRPPVALGFHTEDGYAFTGGAGAGDTCRLLLSSSARSRASAHEFSWIFCCENCEKLLKNPGLVAVSFTCFLFGAAKK